MDFRHPAVLRFLIRGARHLRAANVESELPRLHRLPGNNLPLEGDVKRIS